MRVFNFDFNKHAPKYFAISLIAFAAIAVFTFVFGIQLDIQFKGGTMATYAYEGDIPFDQVKSQAKSQLGIEVGLTNTTDVASGMETMVLSIPGDESFSLDEMTEFTAGLQEAFPAYNLRSVRINNTDPTIGQEFLAKCMTAVALALVLMTIYVAFRFRRIGGLSAGVMCIVALFHDCIIVFGVFVILRIPINDNFIAVILAVLGYSINDTIIVYDRIRENKRLHGGKLPVGQLVSRSINQTLTRSINTTATTAMVMVVVTIVAMIYNVQSIVSFSLPLTVGLVAGTYSTICIAGPLWIKWQEYKLRKKTA